MVSLKRCIKLLPLFSLLIIPSCAKVGYLWDQGWGQMSLLTSARSNAEVLKDPKIEAKQKDKIRLIETYKKYFYEFWDKEPSSIYSETTILETEAVTHLVIASPLEEVKAVKHCFPFMGCFPYLGFFSKDKAYDFAKELETEKKETHVRPVYAYSTLGYFEDKILSSFFYYGDYELAELIFHELFHTIFFVKDEVGLNESLANHFSRLMAFKYFDLTDSEKKSKMDKRAKRAALSRYVASQFKLYNEELRKSGLKEKEKIVSFRKNYFLETLKPSFSAFCSKEKIEYCFPLKKEWNHASMAAFMTYEKKADKITTLQKSLNLDLKAFYGHIESELKAFNNQDVEEKFSTYLFRNK